MISAVSFWPSVLVYHIWVHKGTFRRFRFVCLRRRGNMAFEASDIEAKLAVYGVWRGGLGTRWVRSVLLVAIGWYSGGIMVRT